MNTITTHLNNLKSASPKLAKLFLEEIKGSYTMIEIHHNEDKVLNDLKLFVEEYSPETFEKLFG